MRKSAIAGLKRQESRLDRQIAKAQKVAEVKKAKEQKKKDIEAKKKKLAQLRKA